MGTRRKAVVVKRWVPYGLETIKDEQQFGWLGGWFNFQSGGHRWADYLANFKEEVHPYLEAVRASVLETGRRTTGEQHQYSQDGMPVFSDGKALSLSYRAWGDLMAAIWSEKENKDYSYMDFYM